MVKALVFGTKDLCVRIAPWSRMFLHDFLFFSRIVWFSSYFWWRVWLPQSEPTIRVEIVHGRSLVRPSQVALAGISIATWPFIECSYPIRHALLSLPTPIHSDISSSPFTPSLSMPSSEKSLKTSHAILKPNAVPAPWPDNICHMTLCLKNRLWEDSLSNQITQLEELPVL